MSDAATNPFAPRPVVAPTPAPRTLEPVPMDFFAVLERSGQLAVAHIGPVLLVLLATVVLEVGLGVTDALLEIAGSFGNEAVFWLSSAVRWGVWLIGHTVTLFLTLGATRLFLAMARGEPVGLGMVVGQGRSLPFALVAEALLAAAALLAWSPTFLALVVVSLAGLPSLIFGLVMLGNALLVVGPMIAIGIGVQFYLYAIVDRGAGPLEALQRSWRLTYGHKVELVLWGLGFGAVGMMLSCVTLGLGYLLALPMLTLVQAVIYDALVAQARISGTSE